MRVRWSGFASVVLVSAALVGCGGGGDGGGGGDPTGPSAASLEKVAGDAVQGSAGLAVDTRPAVRVLNTQGHGMAGVRVTFAVVGGNGSITGATQETDANGIATVGGWTLGQGAGTNSLSATVRGLDPVTFTVSGQAGPAAQLVKSAASDNQTASPGSAVTVPPSVTVTDQFGNPKPGVAVTFAVASGGGAITGANATSSASGNAAVGSWKLGAGGVNTLTATVAGLPAVTFTATAADPCPVVDYALGATVNGALTNTDCSNGRYLFDFYRLTLPTRTSVGFTMTPSGFAPWIDVYDRTQAATPFPGHPVGSEGTSTVGPFTLRAILLPGTYVLGLNTYNQNVSGSYSFSASPMAEDPGGCSPSSLSVQLTISTNQTLTDNDCTVSVLPGLRGDDYALYLKPGERVVITMSPTGFVGELRVLEVDAGGNVVTTGTATGASSGAPLTVTVTNATGSSAYRGLFIFAARSGGSGTQNYSISFQP